jgi:hypothetical protein
MNHDHDELFSPSAKAKVIGTIRSSGSTTAAIIKVPHVLSRQESAINKDHWPIELESMLRLSKRPENTM